ncbi:type II toxin-antitoxin system VapC family toxin [Halapricum hydrolyticum]|uniref:PIN domain-containing protein n=1 Tax=Halapricum hydrolyticum TaxID=2979991 RepID=A0AAE3IA93_9EURY|nr:PIN domain-containing protein [Halapricum hydrolyticum]MCU4718163.1 PIN domain-containing protein [Halapricum hydrolyticum]MCU4726417.1 PIN domain-containing protein [Halapricum hydrolyticum]
MSEPRPLFVDTNAFVALFDADDVHHDRATSVIDGIRDRNLPYGPIFTSRYVLSETATTLLYGVGHRAAAEALRTIRASSTFNVLEVTASLFERTVEQFTAYDDQQISFVDHLNAVLSDEFDIEYIFAFEDDFRTLGLTRVPVDTGDAM